MSEMQSADSVDMACRALKTDLTFEFHVRCRYVPTATTVASTRTENLVHQRSPVTSQLDTTFLLNAAEQRRLRGGGKSSLFSCLLDEVFAVLSARSVHVWEIGTNLEPRLLWQVGQGEGVQDHAQQAVLGQVNRVSHVSDTSNDDSLSKWVTSSEIAAGIRIVLDLAIPDVLFDHHQLIEFVDVLADLHRRSMVTVLLEEARRARELLQILARLHSDLDPVRVATCLASDPAEFLNCHRISVARKTSPTSWDLVTATAVNNPDPRADASRQLCGIVQAASQAATAFTAGAKQGFPPGLVGAVESTTNAISDVHLVRPLTVSGRWENAGWAAVFEGPADGTAVRSEAALHQICTHAALAFQNCSEHSNSGIISTFRRVRQMIGRRRVVVAGGLIAAGLFGLLVLKLELRIEVLGKLVPSERRFVFAPEDGVVSDVFIEDGSAVTETDRLCVLRNEDLEIQLESVDGEVASTHARLAALESLRGDRNLAQSGMISVEQAELKQRLIALEAQADILNRRISRLTMNATMSGQVYGDRLQEFLKGRPVQRGQYLFEVANPAGGWELDLRIPELEVRHVIKEQAARQAPLLISFAIETDPEKELSTSLSRLSASTEVDEFGRLSVTATAVPGKADLLNPRPGAGVVGYIHCGRRQAGYVLFRRIIESFQRGWWK
ncbi:MAG: hypothetical protein DWI22_20540 [Planctomycetota bacterium]|nr:MAG: hypothetical protein DWI22_20540 [Planctomycetota bacterium]